MAHRIFISLTHHDNGIAEALRNALNQLFGDFFQVNFSTSQQLEGGIKSGEDWFQWIVAQVKECDFALVLITPSSVNKPWILWEAGAVAGAALATSEGGMRKVRPLVYQVPTDMIPSPIRDSKVQFRRGDSAADFKGVLREILNDFRNEVSGDRVVEFGEKITATIDEYLLRVSACLLDAPALASPSVIEEWRLRLDELLRQNRASEAEHLHDWMDVAFGRGASAQPLDLRIHSRLADLYLKAKNHPRAIAQLKLARQMAPRDIFVLRQLGKAYLESGDRDQAREVLDRIDQLDKRAVVHNAECAALAGRWFRSGGNFKRAEEVFQAALDADRSSYYLANLLAEVRLEDGRPEAAAEAYRQALAIIRSLHETNVWVHATAANAAFFIGDDAVAGEHLVAIRHERIDAGTRGSIERGLQAIAERVSDGAARLEGLLTALRP